MNVSPFSLEGYSNKSIHSKCSIGRKTEKVIQKRTDKITSDNKQRDKNETNKNKSQKNKAVSNERTETTFQPRSSTFFT